MLFKPRWAVPTWHFQLDVELLERLFQLLLVSSIVCSDSIVEQDELVVQHFHLFGSKGKINRGLISLLKLIAVAVRLRSHFELI